MGPIFILWVRRNTKNKNGLMEYENMEWVQFLFNESVMQEKIHMVTIIYSIK
jgi:hypothetical protein